MRGGVAGVTTPVCYQASGSLTLMRVEAVSTAYDTPLAPLGRREAVHRLQGRLQRL
jgi:hypothetical protein